MAYDATITTEDEIDVMSGENVDATGATADRKAALVKQAEGYLSSLMKLDVTSEYASGLKTNVKTILNEYGARSAANSLILFNISAYTNQTEAQDLVNYNFARMERIEKILRDGKTETFMKT